MTTGGEKLKLGKHTDMYIKLWVFNGVHFKSGVHFAILFFLTLHELHNRLKLYVLNNDQAKNDANF